jgi:hypothetical protein
VVNHAQLFNHFNSVNYCQRSGVSDVQDDRALSAIDLFILSATPFSCGVLRTVECLLMLCCSQKILNSSFVYSVPLFDLRHLIFLPVWFSTSAFHNLNLVNVSDLCRMKHIQTYLEKSSINVKNYTCPPWDAVFIGSQTSEWI